MRSLLDTTSYFLSLPFFLSLFFFRQAYKTNGIPPVSLIVFSPESPVGQKVSVFADAETLCIAVQSKHATDSTLQAVRPFLPSSLSCPQSAVLRYETCFPVSHESLMTPGRSGSRNSQRQLRRKWERRRSGPAPAVVLP